jgi:hypothetical protein
MQGIVRSSNASKMTRNQLAVPSSFAASIPRLPRVLRPVVKSPLALVLVAIGLLQSSAEVPHEKLIPFVRIDQVFVVIWQDFSGVVEYARETMDGGRLK